jgi:hypothetical protein
MERKLASIQVVESISQIDGADKIELARVLGWQCVVKRGEFRPGDLCTYVEIDSQMPEKPEYEFLRSRKFRVRTIKLRGVFSQGLLLPPVPGKKVGEDVTEILGITKYDPQAQEEKANLSNPKYPSWCKKFMKYSAFRWLYFKINQKPKRGFPEWISKTDETRIQAIPEILQDPDFIASKKYITQKVDGCSGTYFLESVKTWWCGSKRVFGACSRNVNVTNDPTCRYIEVARKFKIKEALEYLSEKYNSDVAIQGEIAGPGIQKNKDGFNSLRFFVFNVFIRSENRYLNISEMTVNCGMVNLETVPILEWDFSSYGHTVDSLVDYSIGSSVFAPVPREGVVVRTHNMRTSFKAINPEFLIKYEE